MRCGCRLRPWASRGDRDASLGSQQGHSQEEGSEGRADQGMSLRLGEQRGKTVGGASGTIKRLTDYGPAVTH